MPKLGDMISYEDVLRLAGTVKGDRHPIAALEDLLLDRVNEPDEA